MRVFVDPIPTLGIAMKRVARALAVTAPPEVTIVDDPAQADIQVLHAVDRQVLQHLRAPRYAVMMHCLNYEAATDGSGGNVPVPMGPTEPWAAVWQDALVVWSYYDLLARPFRWGRSASSWHQAVSTPSEFVAPHFYYAPLGVDGSVFNKPRYGTRDIGALTTGYVSGPQAEAIEEVALAAHQKGLLTVHLGPAVVKGMDAQVPGWRSVTGIDDPELAALYGQVEWVSGLRHGEGFELPVLEGLACGCRPFCFDLPVYRAWFETHAAFVPESHGEALVEHLVQRVFCGPPRPVLPPERRLILETFDWQRIGEGFWTALLQVAESRALQVAVPATPQASVPRVQITSKPKVVWVGDSPTTAWTGFGRASRHILQALAPVYNMTVIGTTHNGAPYDRTEFPYDIWPLDVTDRIAVVVDDVRPDAVIVQHDPWIVPVFAKAAGNVPVIGTIAVDGKNCAGGPLNRLAHAIFWTDFGQKEAALGGYFGPSTVIPLGVDLERYTPISRQRARESLRMPPSIIHDAFIVGVVCRNQPRKRLDLTVRHFAEWVKRLDIPNAVLYVQTGATGEAAFDVSSMMQYERLSNRLILVEPPANRPIAEATMPVVYAAMDAFWSTTQGEGFGLPALEAMACGRPTILPNWSGYGDWAQPAAYLVPCGDVGGTINPAAPAAGVKVAVYGGVVDLEADVRALDTVYRQPEVRSDLVTRGLALAADPRYRWAAIGAAYVDVIKQVLTGPVITRREEVLTT